jgi:hypothetical protein
MHFYRQPKPHHQRFSWLAVKHREDEGRGVGEKQRRNSRVGKKVGSTSGRRQTVQTSSEIADFRFWTGKVAGRLLVGISIDNSLCYQLSLPFVF